MSDSTIWWLVAGALIALELTTGTIYLLMLAAGGVAGALAAHAGVGVAGQLVVASVVGLALVVGWYFIKKRRPGDPSARSLRSVNLDIGETVVIEQWAADRSAAVRYRGAQWTALLQDGIEPEPGLYRVVELQGARLIVAKA